MQKKSKKKLIMTVIAAVLILPLLLFAVFLWYLPQYWFNKLQNEYLLQNRHVLRTEKVQAGAFNKFILSGVQLGSGKKTLFTAPRAELLLNTNFAGRLDSVPVKGLILYDTRTRIDCKRRKIYINGMLLEKFVRELQKLPMSVDGKKLELEIYSQLALGSNNPASDLHLKVKVFDDKLNIFGSWRSSADSKYSGSWRAVIDLSHDEWAVTLDKYISEIFMQEILLRSGVPAKATALLDKAMICGNGSFSGSFRDLLIKEFTYSGKVESPAISFYKHRINNIAPFEIELKKNTDNIVCRIPQLDLPGRQSTQIRNINISYRKKINFSAECNLQKLVSNNFCKNSNFAVKTIFSADDRVSGSWDPATDQWQFNRNISSTLPGTMTWEVKGATVSLKPEKIEVEAEGKGSAGTLKQKISFKEVEFYTADNLKKAQGSAGSFTVKAVFGLPDRPDQHTLGTSCSNFSAITPWGTVELPGISLNMDLQAKEDGSLDIFASLGGKQAKTVMAQSLYSATGWRVLLRLTADRKSDRYHLKTFDFKSDKFKLDFRKKEYEIPDLQIRLNGAMEQKRLTAAAVHLAAGKLIAAGINIDKARLDLDYNSSRNTTIQGKASCNKGFFAETTGFIVRKLDSAEAQFTLADWSAKPDNMNVKARFLEWQKDDFSGIFQNSQWQIQRKKNGNFDCTTTFDYLRLQSKDKKFGSGQFGKSSLSMNLSLTADKKLNKFDLLGILAHISWLKGEYHVGSENLQCNIEYNKQHSPVLKGNITMSKTNILGPSLTASTPELSGSFTAVDRKNITGSIGFAAGSISDPAGKLELRKTEFTLPLNISTEKSMQQQVGNFTAEEVFYKQQREGSFSGVITHFMRLPSGVTDTVGHQIDIDGKLQSVKFPHNPITLNCNWLLPPEKSKIKLQFTMPETKLEQPLVLSEYLAFPVSCTALKGHFTLDGNVEFDSEQPPASIIKLNSINGDWQFGDFTAEGLTAAGVLTFADNKYSFMPQDITIARLLWQDYIMLDNELNVSLNNDGKLQIANWRGSFLGGKFRSIQIPAVSIEKITDIPPMKMALEDMPLTAFFNKFGLRSFISDAKLNGDILFNIRQNKLFVDQADLAFKAPAGKLLQLKLKDPSSIKMRDIQFRDFTIAILNAMKCYQANFNFSTTPDAITMKVKAEGTPASPIPFVYQGRGGRTPFRRAEPGENGFAGEIELNVNLKLHPDTPDV